MKNPTQYALWENPALVAGPMKETFDLVDTYADKSHLLRYLLKCRECGQLYFYEWYEEIDWVDGNDPQYSTYIPVESGAEIEQLKNALMWTPSVGPPGPVS
jgi:hypothetical protein